MKYISLFFSGLVLGGMLIGAAWKSSVISGNYFSVGNTFYFCKSAVIKDN